jgi:hypothetical protein
MLRKSTLMAIVASAVLGLAVLAPGAADAKPGHGHGGFHKHHGHGHGHGHFRRHRPHWHGHWRRHRCWHGRCHRPIWYYPRPVYYAARPVYTAPGPCTCLSKEYTQEGAVLFKDRCTNEMAMNPPAIAPTAQYAPQQPQSYVPQYPPQAAAPAAQ